jgi:hypothetical protein
VASILGALVLAVVIGIVLYVVWRFLPRIRRYRPPKGYREERTTLLTPAEMLRAVVTWLLSLFRKGGERVVQMVERTRRRIWGKYPEDPVRRVYVQLLRRSAAAGVTRPPNATPDEFGGRMAGHWPDVAFDLGAITEAYVQRRYGEVQPELEALGRLGRHWQNVRTAIRVPRTVPGRQRPTDPQSGDGV